MLNSLRTRLRERRALWYETRMNSALAAIEPMILPEDSRIYFWMPAEHVGFLQGVIDAEDNLARIRTERQMRAPSGEQNKDRALILLICDRSRRQESLDLLRHVAEELEITIDFVDSL